MGRKAKTTPIAHATNVMLDAEGDGDYGKALYWSDLRARLLEREIRRGRIQPNGDGSAASNGGEARDS